MADKFLYLIDIDAQGAVKTMDELIALQKRYTQFVQDSANKTKTSYAKVEKALAKINTHLDRYNKSLEAASKNDYLGTIEKNAGKAEASLKSLLIQQRAVRDEIAQTQKQARLANREAGASGANTPSKEDVKNIENLAKQYKSLGGRIRTISGDLKKNNASLNAQDKILKRVGGSWSRISRDILKSQRSLNTYVSSADRAATANRRINNSIGSAKTLTPDFDKKASSAFTTEIKKQQRVLESYLKTITKLNRQLKILEARYKNLGIGIDRTNTSSKKGRKQVDALRNSVGNLGRESKKAGVSVKSATSSFNGFAGLASATVVLSAIVAGMKAVVTQGAQFEQAIKNVQAVSGASGAQIKELESDALRIGGATQFTATSVAGLQLSLARLGFSTDEILKVTESVVDLGTATGESVQETAKVIGQSIRAYGLAAEDSTRVADLFAASFNSSALTLETFAEASKLIAPVAATLGIPIEEATAAIGILADRGLEGTIATQTIGTALQRLADDTKKYAQEAEAAGIEVFNQSGEFVGLSQLIDNTRKATADLTEQERLATVSRVFGAQSAKNFSLLLDAQKKVVEDGTVVIKEGGEALAAYTQQLRDSGGEAKRVADIQRDSTIVQFNILISAVERLAIELFNLSEGGVNTLISSLTGLVGVITDFVATPVSDQLRQQQVEFNTLATRLVRYNEVLSDATSTSKENAIAEAEKAKVIEEIQDKYPDYLKNLDLETASNQQIASALDVVNGQLREKILLQGQTESLQDAQKDAENAQTAQLKAEGEILASARRTEQFFKDFGVDLEIDTSAGRSVEVIAKDIQGALDQLSNLKDEATNLGGLGEAGEAIISIFQAENREINNVGNALLRYQLATEGLSDAQKVVADETDIYNELLERTAGGYDNAKDNTEAYTASVADLEDKLFNAQNALSLLRLQDAPLEDIVAAEVNITNIEKSLSEAKADLADSELSVIVEASPDLQALVPLIEQLQTARQLQKELNGTDILVNTQVDNLRGEILENLENAAKGIKDTGIKDAISKEIAAATENPENFDPKAIANLISEGKKAQAAADKAADNARRAADKRRQQAADAARKAEKAAADAIKKEIEGLTKEIGKALADFDIERAESLKNQLSNIEGTSDKVLKAEQDILNKRLEFIKLEAEGEKLLAESRRVLRGESLESQEKFEREILEASLAGIDKQINLLQQSSSESRSEAQNALNDAIGAQKTLLEGLLTDVAADIAIGVDTGRFDLQLTEVKESVSLLENEEVTIKTDLETAKSELDDLLQRAGAGQDVTLQIEEATKNIDDLGISLQSVQSQKIALNLEGDALEKLSQASMVVSELESEKTIAVAASEQTAAQINTLTSAIDLIENAKDNDAAISLLSGDDDLGQIEGIGQALADLSSGNAENALLSANDALSRLKANLNDGELANLRIDLKLDEAIGELSQASSILENSLTFDGSQIGDSLVSSIESVAQAQEQTLRESLDKRLISQTDYERQLQALREQTQDVTNGLNKSLVEGGRVSTSELITLLENALDSNSLLLAGENEQIASLLQERIKKTKESEDAITRIKEQAQFEQLTNEIALQAERVAALADEGTREVEQLRLENRQTLLEFDASTERRVDKLVKRGQSEAEARRLIAAQRLILEEELNEKLNQSEIDSITKRSEDLIAFDRIANEALIAQSRAATAELVATRQQQLATDLQGESNIEKRKALEQQAANDIAEIERKGANKVRAIRNQLLKEYVALLELRIKAIEANSEGATDAEIKELERLKKTQADTNAEIEANNKATADANVESSKASTGAIQSNWEKASKNIQQTLKAIGQGLSVVGDFAELQSQREIAAIERAMEARKRNIDDLRSEIDEYTRSIEVARAQGDLSRTEQLRAEQRAATERLNREKALLEDVDRQRAVAEKKAFERNKKFAIAQALINASLAIVQAFGAPPPFNFINAGLIAAATAIEIQKIQAQQFEGFKFGGASTAQDLEEMLYASMGAKAPKHMPKTAAAGVVLEKGDKKAKTLVHFMDSKIKQTQNDFSPNRARTGLVATGRATHDGFKVLSGGSVPDKKGIAKGNSHELGGIKIMAFDGRLIEMEGGEINTTNGDVRHIFTKKVAQDPTLRRKALDTYSPTFNPEKTVEASIINQMAGGRPFTQSFGLGGIPQSVKAPIHVSYQMAQDGLSLTASQRGDVAQGSKTAEAMLAALVENNRLMQQQLKATQEQDFSVNPYELRRSINGAGSILNP